MPPVDPFFIYANYGEAALWNLIGVAFLVAALARRAVGGAALRRTLLAAAIAFIAFGWSDVVETRTGAWWRPWWLLLWKGLCVEAKGTWEAKEAKGSKGDILLIAEAKGTFYLLGRQRGHSTY